MTSSDQGPPERPRSEPEIIPPGRRERRDEAESRVWVWVADREGVHRASVPVPGPLMIFLALAGLALVAMVVLAAVLGVVLIWLPLFVVAAGALLIAAAVRQYWWRFRRWLSRR